MTNQKYEHFVTTVEKVTGHPRMAMQDGCKLWCPAHDGNSPSLNVTYQPGKGVGFKCHAGCDNAIILEKLGLPWEDCFEDNEVSFPLASTSPTSTTLKYRDFCIKRKLNGATLSSVWGVEATMWQNRPAISYPTALGVSRVKFLDGQNPKVKWTETGKGHAHWYGLDKATPLGGNDLYIVNGEPSVWACYQEGVPAVCPCGEGTKVKPEMLEALKSSGFSKFRIVFDRDAAGIKGATAMVNALSEAGLSVQALELPSELGPKADVDDLHRTVGSLLAEVLNNLEAMPTKSDADSPFIKISTIEIQQVNWLWEPYVAREMINIFQGHSETGKTWAAMELAARMTRMGHNVVFGTKEDSWEYTLKPRFEKLGGYPENLYAFKDTITINGKKYPLSLDNLYAIEDKIKEIAPALIILDPLSAWLGTSINMNSANEVWGPLGSLLSLASSTKAAILLVQHLNKAKGAKALHDGQGSVAINGSARNVMLFGEAQTGRHAMVHIKCSVAKKGKSLGYEIADDGFRWIGESSLKAADLRENELGADELSALDSAKKFLTERLADGPQSIEAMVARWTQETGYSYRTLDRGCRALGVITDKGWAGKGTWSLPVPPQPQPAPPTHIEFGKNNTLPATTAIPNNAVSIFDKHCSDEREVTTSTEERGGEPRAEDEDDPKPIKEENIYNHIIDKVPNNDKFNVPGLSGLDEEV